MPADRRAARVGRRLAAAGLLLLLSACVMPVPDPVGPRPAEPARPLALPPATSGEACELRRLNTGGPAVAGSFLIRCGGADQPSASFARELEPWESLETVVRTHPFVRAARGDAACDAPRRVGLPQGPTLRSAVAVVCRPAPFHAPLLVGATVVGRLLVTFATLPQAAPVLEAAVAAMVDEGLVPTAVLPSGTMTLADLARDAEAAAGGVAGLTDVERLRALARDAEVAAADGDPAGALALRRDLRERLVRLWGPETTALGPALTEEADLLLRLDRPDEARHLLEAAAGPTARSPLWRDRVRLALVEARAALALGRPDAVPDRLAAADAAREAGAPDAALYHLAAADVLLGAGLPEAAGERLALTRAAAAADRSAAVRAPDILSREAGIAERQGDRAVAVERLSGALALRRTLDDDDAGVAELLVRLARLDLADGRADDARARWREAMGILLRGASAAAPLPAETTAAFLDSVFAGPGDPDAAALEQVFLLLQTPDDPLARLARLRMLRAVVQADPAVADRRLDLAEAEAALADLRIRRARLRGDRTGSEPTPTADAAVAAAARAVAERRTRLAAASPATAILAPARRVPAAEAAAALAPGEVLVIVAPGEVRTTVLTLSSDGRLTGHRLGPDAATLATRTAALDRSARAVLPRDGARTVAGSAADVLGPAAAVAASATRVILLAAGQAFDAPAQILFPDGPPVVAVPSMAAFRTSRRPDGPAGPVAVATAVGGPFLGGPGRLDGGDCAASVPPLALRLPALRGADALAEAMATAGGAEGRATTRTGPRAAAEALAERSRAAVLAMHLALPAGGACRGDPGLLVGDAAMVPATTLATLATATSTVVLAAPTGAGAGPGIAVVAEALLAAGARRVVVADPGLPRATLRETAAFVVGRSDRAPATVRVIGAGP